MRRLGVLLVLVSGCFDFGGAEAAYCLRNPGFCQPEPVDAGAAADAGCPARFARPDAGACELYEFNQGLPPGLKLVDPLGHADAGAACGMYHVGVKGLHDLWFDNTDAVRIEVEQPFTSRFALTAWFHGSLERNEQFVASYVRAEKSWVQSTLTSLDNAPSGRCAGFTVGGGADQTVSALRQRVSGGMLTLTQQAPSSYFATFDTGLEQGGTMCTWGLPVDAGQHVGFAIGDTDDAGVDVYVDYLMLCHY